jgi:hypothetical protein
MAYQKLQVSRALQVIPSDTVNIPDPASEYISSTSTGASAGQLVDTSVNFEEKGVKVGDIVYADLIGTPIAAYVTELEDADNINVSTAIPSGVDYKIYRATEFPNNGCVLYIGGAGDVKVMTAGADIVEFEASLAGTYMPVNILRVYATGHTTAAATKILALW